jgi:beta-fructofuranosidase
MVSMVQDSGGQTVNQAQALRRALAGDPHRPHFHFLPPSNWMNDPNGLIQWQDQVHMFYQYNPGNPWHDRIHWGHTVSSDLVHWADLPVALEPTPDGPDRDGCWSGCAVDHQGVPMLIYTGVFPQVVCLATSPDNLLTWHKHPANPVIDGPPADFKDRTGGHFRDPFVWYEDGCWYMLIGSKMEGVGGMILLYQSQDLTHWEYLHPLMMGDTSEAEPFWTGTMWECPVLIPAGKKRALLLSMQATPVDHLYAVYYTGRYQEQRFVAETQGILVHGGYYYAPQAVRLADGRHVLWGWLKEGRSQRVSQWAGWSGVMSLPATIETEADGALRLQPVEELKMLRQEHCQRRNMWLNAGQDEHLAEVQSDCLEILVQLEVDQNTTFGVRLRHSPDGQEQTRIVYRSQTGSLSIERDQSSLSPEVERQEASAPLSLATGATLQLQVFVDRSVIEVFADGGRTCLASRVYPLRPDSLHLSLFSADVDLTVKALDVWKLKSIW